MSVCAVNDERDRTKADDFDPKTQACATCRFWMPEQTLTSQKDPKAEREELAFGFCRRNPPRLVDHLVQLCCGKPVFGRQQDIDDLFGPTDHFDATAFPGTFHSEWCGEFQWLPFLQLVEMPVC